MPCPCRHPCNMLAAKPMTLAPAISVMVCTTVSTTAKQLFQKNSGYIWFAIEIKIEIQIGMTWNRNQNDHIFSSIWFVTEIRIRIGTEINNFYCCYLIILKIKIRINSNFHLCVKLKVFKNWLYNLNRNEGSICVHACMYERMQFKRGCLLRFTHRKSEWPINISKSTIILHKKMGKNRWRNRLT